jgi:ethylbenzene dioxygenase beta subunit
MTDAINHKPDFSTYPTLDRAEARAAAEALLALKGEGAPVDDARLSRIQRFYFLEARLLDEERHHEWYDLLADDLFYWAPLRENRYRRDDRRPLDPEAMALFDERKADIALRIGRLDSNLAWTEDPPTRHTYVISNIEAFARPDPGEYEAHSSFVQYRNRSEHDEATLIGRRRDILRIEDGELRIARRLILLQQSVLLTKNLAAFF